MAAFLPGCSARADAAFLRRTRRDPARTQRFAQQELDLGVDAAQLGLCKALESRPQRWVDPEQERLLRRHAVRQNARFVAIAVASSTSTASTSNMTAAPSSAVPDAGTFFAMTNTCRPRASSTAPSA